MEQPEEDDEDYIRQAGGKCKKCSEFILEEKDVDVSQYPNLTALVRPTVDLSLPELYDLYNTKHLLMIKTCVLLEPRRTKANEYRIENFYSHRPYFWAYEIEHSLLNKLVFCGIRPFNITLKNKTTEDIISVHRPMRGNWWWCCFFRQEAQVFCPPTDYIGSIRQTFSFLMPRFVITDELDHEVMLIVGTPCTTTACGKQIDFVIYSRDGKVRLGRICKQWVRFYDLLNPVYDEENIEIAFPSRIDSAIKAVLIGAAIFLEMMYYEHSIKEVFRS